MSELTDQLRRYVHTKRRLKRLEAVVEQRKERLALLEQVLLDRFELEKIDKMSIDGALVYRSKKFSHKRRDGVAVRDVSAKLKSVGFGDLVEEKYEWQSLNAALRERYEAGLEMPEGLGELIEVKEFPSLPIRGV